jgi:putative transposase
MPRRQTPFIQGLYYHVYNRGNNRQSVFFQPENYLYFLRNVKRYLAPLAKVTAYCLMPTHYHILVRLQTSEFLTGSSWDEDVSAKNSEVSLSRAMMRLSVSYTKAINKRFARVGSLFQGQFQAKPIQNYHHLLNLCVYIMPTLSRMDWLLCLKIGYTRTISKGLGSVMERWLTKNSFGSISVHLVSIKNL